MTNSITILHTRDHNTATKTFHRQPDGRIREYPYRSGTYFRYTEYEIASIRELSDMLHLIEGGETWMIIRGQVKPEHAAKHEVTRTLHDDPERNQVAMLKDHDDGLNWMMADFDKIALPDGMAPQHGIEMLIRTLPPEFHTASYHYQLSSSAGIDGVGVRTVEKRDETTGLMTSVEEEYLYTGWATISVHVFFWLKHKTKNVAQWAKNLNATRGTRVIDPAPLQTVQPNYTARPTFIGMDDPLGAERSGFVEKTHDEVDLIWIDAPIQYVSVNGIQHKVGSVVMQDGAPLIATPSLEDRIAAIGVGNEFRDPLKRAISFYFWYHGKEGREEEIKDLLHAAFPMGIKHYLEARHLHGMVRWFAARSTHEPIYQGKRANDALAARLIAIRKNAPPMPDTEAAGEEDYTDWLFELEDSGLTCYFVEGECGVGKTEWLLDMIGNRPSRYIICLPRIDLIREVAKRLFTKFPHIDHTKGYAIETVYTDKENDIRDPEDTTDDEHSAITVTEQVIRFRKRVEKKRHVVLFVTHAALLLTDWHDWGDFNLMVDEIPDPYHTYSRDFSNTCAFVRDHAEVYDAEANYYRLALTDAGHRKFIDGGRFDDNEPALRSLLEAIHTPNISVFARRATWDGMASQRVHLMRLVDARFLAPFKTVTVMGDEFTRSTLALAFQNKYGVDWQPHPDWKPTRSRATPLKDRANIFYFVSKEERRGSVTSYEEGGLIPKLIEWFDQPENDPGQVLITTNRKFESLFDDTKALIKDAGDKGLSRTTTITRPPRAWVPPKLSGTDEYKSMSNVAFFAAMRPSKDEKSFVERSLLISEDDIIRWREYNTLYQFVMRIGLRRFEADEAANIYVFDEWQAEYLRERFGGCRSYTHLKGVFGEPVKTKKGGRPKVDPSKPAMTALERKQSQRKRERQAILDAREPTRQRQMNRISKTGCGK